MWIRYVRWLINHEIRLHFFKKKKKRPNSRMHIETFWRSYLVWFKQYICQQIIIRVVFFSLIHILFSIKWRSNWRELIMVQQLISVFPFYKKKCSGLSADGLLKMKRLSLKKNIAWLRLYVKCYSGGIIFSSKKVTNQIQSCWGFFNVKWEQFNHTKDQMNPWTLLLTVHFFFPLSVILVTSQKGKKKGGS